VRVGHALRIQGHFQPVGPALRAVAARFEGRPLLARVEDRAGAKVLHPALEAPLADALPDFVLTDRSDGLHCTPSSADELQCVFRIPYSVSEKHRPALDPIGYELRNTHYPITPSLA